MFLIEDESHAEHIARFQNRAEAVLELRRLAALAWDAEPNLAPCSSWETCGRNYELVEYDDAGTHWQELNRSSALTVSRKGSDWLLID